MDPYLKWSSSEEKLTGTFLKRCHHPTVPATTTKTATIRISLLQTLFVLLIRMSSEIRSMRFSPPASDSRHTGDLRRNFPAGKYRIGRSAGHRFQAPSKQIPCCPDRGRRCLDKT